MYVEIGLHVDSMVTEEVKGLKYSKTLEPYPPTVVRFPHFFITTCTILFIFFKVNGTLTTVILGLLQNISI